jgi:CHAT domain-containing protein
VARAARYSYQANAADLEGDDKEAQRLIKAAAQDQVEARTYFEQSVETAKGVMPIEEVRGLLNLTRLLASGNLEQPNKKPLTKLDGDLIVTHWNRIRELLNNLPDSRDKAYGLINLAEQELKVGIMPVEGFKGELTPREELRPALLFNQALTVARNIGNARAESFALGSLGQLYEGNREYGKAMELTRRAQFAAQQISAPESLYRWQWQVGRLLKAMGAREQAIAAYEQAIATLQSIRGDIVVANQELQFDFREQVEPVYRELMALLLESPTVASGVSRQASVVSSNLEKQGTTEKGQLSKGEASPVKKVVDTLELLKLAELQNFFGDECVQVALSQAGDTTALTDANTVVVYSVILDGQSQIILRSPNGSMKNYPVALSQEGINKEIDQLRYLLELRQTEQYLPQAQKIYNLLIRPLEADLAALKPSTVVFINDGVLRKVPMSALHDGKAFLIEKYAIATTPSLSLTNRQPSNRNNLEALSVGLTVERAPFAALSNVQAEVTAVNKILGGTELIDNTFTLSNLQAQLQKKSYPVVHIATHGKFGVDAESTFLVGFDQRISIENLDNLLRSRPSRQPVELLTLSACQTAAGDNRSALGIAGIAVRAGVESALATLWYINDEATVPLIEEFYRQLRQPNITKAEALRRAQLKMIADVSYNHPAVWSPFILIGNWL